MKAPITIYAFAPGGKPNAKPRRYRVSAVQRGALALHRPIRGTGSAAVTVWNITHVPTGGLITQVPCCLAGLRLFQSLARLPWSDSKDVRAAQAAMKAHGDTIRRLLKEADVLVTAFKHW